MKGSAFSLGTHWPAGRSSMDKAQCNLYQIQNSAILASLTHWKKWTNPLFHSRVSINDLKTPGAKLLENTWSFCFPSRTFNGLWRASTTLKKNYNSNTSTTSGKGTGLTVKNHRLYNKYWEALMTSQKHKLERHGESDKHNTTTPKKCHQTCSTQSTKKKRGH